MEYEHKYKTALKMASELYKEGTINETLIKVFPELIGLEDERIKREVIKEITFYVRDCDEKNKMIAWLKKQKPIEWSNVDDDYFEDVIAFLKDTNDCKENALDCIKWIQELKQRII